MKKTLTLIVLIATVAVFTSCKTNMRRDAKLLAHKTEQCFSLVGPEGPSEENRQKFNECYDEMEVMMDKFDSKYKDDKSSRKFSELYMEEIRKTELDDDTKALFEDLYNMAK